jgi:predicted PurR-regulated permease PerM
LLIFFSVLGGLQVFGVLGLVLGPAVVAITLALLDVVREAGANSRKDAPATSLIEGQAELRDASSDQPLTS